MAGNNGDYEKYDHSKVISQQIERIDKLVTQGPKDSDFDSFDEYFNQIVMGLMTLDGLLEPFKDEEYGLSEQDAGPLDDFQDPGKVSERLSFVRDTFRDVTSLLDRQGLFYVRKNGRREL
ncbi:MAG: hypothetical protein ABEK00_02220 [Candidatus Nanohaloarchaea archaeon]